MDLTYDAVTSLPPQIGLVVLQSDETIERDMKRLLPDSVELLVSRVPSASHVSCISLAAMERVLANAVDLFPLGVAFASIGYGCTSASAEIGPQRIADIIKSTAHTAASSEPLSALIAACQALKVQRVGLVSPYVAEVNQTLIRQLHAHQISVEGLASFNEAEERQVARISPGSIHAAALEFGRTTACDAVFLSCTNLRTLDVIDDLEAALSRPVLSSNQVLAWHLCCQASVAMAPDAPGVLCQTSPSKR